tara:strand:- start:47 stop:427 length:381 start_codon:yes stop_codon:yes gene_type:complete
LKNESKFWHEVKKNTPNIKWTRLESWASLGVPDLLGYHETCGFFTVELKVTKSKKVSLSPHQISFHMTHPVNSFILVKTHEQRCPILYEGAGALELAACGLELAACRLPLESISELETVLLAACSL